MDYSTFDTHTQHTRLCSNNVYLICVIVHVQMWCVCSNTCWSNPKRFLSVLYVFESDFVLSCFQFLFKMHFCVFIKTWFRGCFARSSRLRASREMCLREIKSHIFHTETLATASRVFRDWPFLGKRFLGKNWIFHKITQKLSWLSHAHSRLSASRESICASVTLFTTISRLVRYCLTCEKCMFSV